MKKLIIGTVFFAAIFVSEAYSQETFQFEYGEPNIEEAPLSIIETDDGSLYVGVYKQGTNRVRSLLLKLSEDGIWLAETEFTDKRLLEISNVGNNVFCYGYNELEDSTSLFFTVLNPDLEVITNKNYIIPDYTNRSDILRSRFIKDNGKIHCLYQCHSYYDFIFTVNDSGDSLNSVLLNDACMDFCRNPNNSGYIMTVFAPQGGPYIVNAALADSAFQVYRVDSVDVSPGLYYRETFVEPLNENIVFSSVELHYDINELVSTVIFDTTMTQQSYLVAGPSEYDNNISFRNGIITDDYKNIYTFLTIDNEAGAPYQLHDNWLMLTKTDSLQNIIWEKFYGGDAFYQADNFTLSSDGGIIMAATKFDHEIASYDNAYIFKVDSEGNPSVALDVEDANAFASEVIVYPNPTQGIVNINKAHQIKAVTLEIFDINGKFIKNEKIISDISTIDLTNYPKGTYLYRIQYNDKLFDSGKIVVE